MGLLMTGVLGCGKSLSNSNSRTSATASAAGASGVGGARLAVDRYAAYNKVRGALQYCYARRLREVQDLGKEFAQQTEVQRFVETLAPWLAQAIKLRTQGLKPKEFHPQARQIKARIRESGQIQAQHPSVPAENNRAERELRPLVIARKISFGSQSERGLKTRAVLMSVLLTLRKRSDDGFAAFTRTLDALEVNPTRKPYDLLFNSS